MNLNTIAEVKRPRTLDEIQGWRAGNAWLGGGTWLFSEPQIHTDTLIDLETLGLAVAGDDRRRSRYRRDVPHRRALRIRSAEQTGAPSL